MFECYLLNNLNFNFKKKKFKRYNMPKSKNRKPKKRVAIIGAGPCGIATLVAFRTAQAKGE